MIHPYYSQQRLTADRRKGAWRLILAMIAGLCSLVLIAPIAVWLISRTTADLNLNSISDTQIGTTPHEAFLLFSSFGIFLIATVLLAKKLHHRTISDLTGPSYLFRKTFLRCLLFLFAFIGLTALIPIQDAQSAPIRQLSLSLWISWLPFALIAIAVQVLAEEIFFRGYLQSQFAASFDSLKIGVFLSALFFSLLHYENAQGLLPSLIYTIWAFLFSLAAADLTIRTGSLGPAFAFHLINNCFVVLIAPTAGVLSGFGLYVRHDDFSELFRAPQFIAYQFLFLLAMWLVARFATKG